jgi:2-polyprenyl-6-methoxyphenol hydroxylase-like FAD-dependent oxidoreductase
MPRAIIIGAGVAGTVSALALAKAGWEPQIYEAYDHSAGLDHGVFLTLAVNGLDALAAVDAADAVGVLGFPTGKIRFFTGRGRSLGAMDIGPRLPDGSVTRSLRRAELYATLYGLCSQKGIAITHGKRLIDAEPHGAGVVASFADGTAAEGDVLIGADGLRSTVRSLLDSDAPKPRYTGMGNVGGFCRLTGIEPDGGDYRMIWGKRCFFGYTVAPDGEVWWFANPPSKQPLTTAQIQASSTADIKARLADLFRDDRGPAADIVGATTGHILMGNQYDVPRVPTWHRDNIIVIGDAAHAVSPSTGQGVSLACEDAVILARCLSDASSAADAFEGYEQMRRARVERVTEWGSKMGGTKTAGSIARVIRDLALPHILAKGSTPQAMDKQAWLFNHHVEWPDSPVGSTP